MGKDSRRRCAVQTACPQSASKMQVERNRQATLPREPSNGTVRKPGNFPRQYYLDRVRRVSLSLALPGQHTRYKLRAKHPCSIFFY